MTAEQTADRRAEHGSNNRVPLSPLYFIRDSNLALATTNLRRALDGPFSTKKLQERGPIEIVWTQNPRTGEVLDEAGKKLWRIRNGHNRTRAAIDEIRAGRLPEDTELEFLDVTADVMASRFPESNGREYLTEQEYYMLLGEETVIKGEQAFRRMASHLFTDWRTWVGDEVAERFPALAALHTLGREEYGMQSLNEGHVHDRVDRSGTEIMVGDDENKERNEILKEGLKAMASRIIVSGLGYSQVAFAGYQLVTNGYEDIGEDTRRHEIAGLTALPVVSCRLADNGQRTEFTNRLISTFEGIREPRARQLDMREEDTRAIITAITTSSFDYGDLLEAFDSSSADSLRVRVNKIRVRKDSERYLRDRGARVKQSRSVPRREPAQRDGGPHGDADTHRDAGADTAGEVVTLRNEVERLSSENETLRTIVGRQADELDGVQRTNESLGETVAEQERELVKLRRAGTEKDGIIFGLQDTVAEQERELGTLGETVARLPEELAAASTGAGVQVAAEAAHADAVQDSQAGRAVAAQVFPEASGAARDWEALIKRYDAKTGQGTWFAEKLRRGRELREIDRRFTTILLSRIAGSELKRTGFVPADMDSLRDRSGNSGKDALDSSLTDRLARLASEIPWDRAIPEFRYLVMNHFALSLGARARDLDGKATLVESESQELARLQVLNPKVVGTIKEYWVDHLATRPVFYPQILLYMLYAPSDAPVFPDAVGFIRRQERDSHIADDIISKLKSQSGSTSVEQLFDRVVLGI